MQRQNSVDDKGTVRGEQDNDDVGNIKYGEEKKREGPQKNTNKLTLSQETVLGYGLLEIVVPRREVRVRVGFNVPKNRGSDTALIIIKIFLTD